MVRVENHNYELTTNINTNNYEYKYERWLEQDSSHTYFKYLCLARINESWKERLTAPAAWPCKLLEALQRAFQSAGDG